MGMVAEAEKYKAEDDANKNRVEAKNGLENYCYSLKSSIGSDEVKDKIPSDKKDSLRRQSRILSVGSMLISQLRKKNMKRSRNLSKVLPCQFSKQWVAGLQVVCLELVECQTWVECLTWEVHLQPQIHHLDQQLKRLINQLLPSNTERFVLITVVTLPK